MAGDPLDVFVNGTAIAKGEVVIIGEQFGIRLQLDHLVIFDREDSDINAA